MWPSGLRRVTRNHFSYGGVGSNPAIVVFNRKKSTDRETKEQYRYRIEARVAEWSKALVSGTSLFGGVGSNPTSCILVKRK